jgi:hypothetical protein
MTDPSHDPGGRARLPLSADVLCSGATMSLCGRYRSVLWREWNAAGPSILFVGMNPSVADAAVNDPTVAREMALAKREGASRYVKVNIVDYRATDPRALAVAEWPIRSADCLPTIIAQARQAHRSGGFIVACWGAIQPMLEPYAVETERALRATGGRLLCLGFTQAGHPRHPLYLRKDTPLVPYVTQDEEHLGASCR